jgi:drug/metabolite transporter (DMT)-like permease
MKILLPLLFATIAAIGNALFALGQKQSSDVDNGLLFVSLCGFTAGLIALAVSPLIKTPNVVAVLQNHWGSLLLCGFGLFLTYLGFNLLYSHFGTAPYVLYAVISIITTTLIVGIWWLREPVNAFHWGAILASVVAVVLFSLGQATR